MLAAVGEQSDKPLVSSFLGAEGVPELLRVPDVAGLDRRPRLGAVVPRRRGGGARARPGRRSTPSGCAPRTAPPVDPDDVDAGRARSGWSTRCWREHPDGRRPRPGRS